MMNCQIDMAKELNSSWLSSSCAIIITVQFVEIMGKLIINWEGKGSV